MRLVVYVSNRCQDTNWTGQKKVICMAAFVFWGNDASLQIPTFLVLNLAKLFMKRNYRVETELESFR